MVLGRRATGLLARFLAGEHQPRRGAAPGPVWAVWLAGALWFSSSNDSRKTRNLRASPRCSLSTENPESPVVVQGIAEVVTDLSDRQQLLDAENAKYRTAYSIDSLDPASNTCFRVRPLKVIGVDTADFTGSPTRGPCPNAVSTLTESLIRVCADPVVDWLVAQSAGPADRALLVLHGGPDWDHTYLVEPLSDLGGRYRLVMPDLRGCGGWTRGLADDQYTPDAAGR